MSKYYLLSYPKNPKVQPNWRTKWDTLRFFVNFVANYQKNAGAILVKKNEKKSHSGEKIERGTLRDFSTSVLLENSKKVKGNPSGIFFQTKSLTGTEILREYPLVPLSFLDDVKILRKLSKNCKKL